MFSDKLYFKKEFEEIYSDDYYKNLKNFSNITDKRYSRILSYLSRYSMDNRLLDIGCGAGQFLLVAKRNGWYVSGIEISPAISRWANNNLDLKIRCGEFMDMNFERSYFDVVTMFESIEHLNSPNSYFKKINLILKNGGILFVTTPNFSSLSKIILGKNWKVFAKEHLFYFTPFTLRYILQDNGFKVIKSQTKNFSIIELKNAILKHEDLKHSDLYEERFRARIEGSALLRLLKRSINTWLDFFDLGDSIWIFAQKVKDAN